MTLQTTVSNTETWVELTPAFNFEIPTVIHGKIGNLTGSLRLPQRIHFTRLHAVGVS